MKFRNEFVAVLVCAILFSAFVFVLSGVRAQQTPTKNPSVNTSTQIPSPSPTVTPAPKVSPTPDLPVEDDEVVKIDTDLVNILFTAQDKDRRLLTTLKKEDIRILENNQPQEIFSFQRQIDLPLSIAILIDTSGSQERTLPEEKSAASEFVTSVVRANKDEVGVLTFTGETTLEQGLTGNVARLRRAIDRIEFIPAAGTSHGVLIGTPPISGTNQQVQGSTAIWDAIWITANEVLALAPEQTRRVIILVSDGVNTYGTKRIDDAVNEALRNEATIYCVGIGDNYYSGVDKGSLRKIAERTGGKAYFPLNESDLRRAFTEIEIEMRSQYLVSYQPSNTKRDGTYRTIEVQLTNSELAKQKVKITHRQGYFAKSEPNTPARKK